MTREPEQPRTGDSAAPASPDGPQPGSPASSMPPYWPPPSTPWQFPPPIRWTGLGPDIAAREWLLARAEPPTGSRRLPVYYSQQQRAAAGPVQMGMRFKLEGDQLTDDAILTRTRADDYGAILRESAQRSDRLHRRLRHLVIAQMRGRR